MRFTKHIHVLHLLSTVPAPPLRVPGVIRGANMTPEQAIDAWDHLFTYIHNHWAKPMTAIEPGALVEYRARTSVEASEIFDCGVMMTMSRDELLAKLESLPPYFTESVFPVAVGRWLLRDMAIPLNHRKSTTFREFHNRYATMILNY
jgi:hypothetical protein